MEIEEVYTVLGIPVASAWVLKKLCGPALDVAGEILADRLRSRPLKHLRSIFAEAGNYATDKGLDLKPLPLKTIVPLFEGASLEEELELQTLWARLLANASANQASISLTGIAGDLLRAVSPADASVLDAMYRGVVQRLADDTARYGARDGQTVLAAEPDPSAPYCLISRSYILGLTGLSREDFEACYDNITRFNVIEAPLRHDLDGRELDRDHYAFTRLGWRVMELLIEKPAGSSQNRKSPQTS